MLFRNSSIITTQNKVLYVNMEYNGPPAPNLVFARETCTPYTLTASTDSDS